MRSINPHTTTTQPLTCPAWCALPADHGDRDEVDHDGTLYLVHRAPVLADAGSYRLDLVQHVFVAPDGTTEHEPTRIVVTALADDDGLTVDRARHLAAALALAAELATGGAR